MYALPAITTERLRDLLSQREPLFSLIDALGSPLLVMVPDEFQANVRLFSEVFRKYDLEGRIWYAVKVNKAKSFLETAALCRIGADVSSPSELGEALAHGISGNRIGISGPLKDPRFIRIAMAHGCTISLDSLTELSTIVQISRAMGLDSRTRIIIRLSGFEISTHARSEAAPSRPENGRFGISLGDIPELFQMLTRQEIKSWVKLDGFGFHIDNHSVRDRGEALSVVTDLLLHARAKGHESNEIDMGGGFSVQYIRPEDWHRFMDVYTASLSGDAPEMMFRNKPFGVITEGGVRKNRGNFYPYDTEAFKEGFLEEVLQYSPKGKGESIHRILGKHNIRLTIEPGKSLVDQGGLTLCRIKGLKHSTLGNPLLQLEMNISHLYEQLIGSEFAVDPVLLKRPGTTPPNPSEFVGHLAGNLCLESDIIAWRKIHFDCRPERGDLLVFVNTAGYQMDFVQTRMHLNPLPKRIAVYRNADGWQWKLDEQFSTLDLLREFS